MAPLHRTSIQVSTTDIPGQINELLNAGWRVESIHPVGDWALVVMALVVMSCDAEQPSGIHVEIGGAYAVKKVVEEMGAQGWRLVSTHTVSDKRHQHSGEVLGTTIAAFLQR